jgi:hypothetical protein
MTCQHLAKSVISALKVPGRSHNGNISRYQDSFSAILADANIQTEVFGKRCCRLSGAH